MVSEAGKTLKLLKSLNAHAIAKQNRPLTDYKWLSQVDKSKGLDIGNTYQTEHARDFIGCIAKYERVFHDKFSFGQTVFLNCLTECQTSCLGFSICLMLYWVHLAWAGFELTLEVIGTDCIGSCLIQLPFDHDHDGPSY